jgi:hypothetical protein
MIAPADTTPGARELQLAAYRSMGGARRVMAALQMSEEARRITLAGFQARHPEWSATEVERAVAAVLLGPELAAVVLAPTQTVAGLR